MLKWRYMLDQIDIDGADFETPQPQEKAKKTLETLGLSLPDLVGKTVLDVGSAERYLERTAKEQGIEATIISYDIRKDRLRAGETTGMKAVQGDANEHLPFRDGMFDLIINGAGPIRGLGLEESIHRYLEAMRVLKDGGELRTNNPFTTEDGVNLVMYDAAVAGDLHVDPDNIIQFNQLLRHQHRAYLAEQGEEDPVTDEVLPKDALFWNHEYQRLPRETQVRLYDFLGGELGKEITRRGIHVDISLQERPGYDYSPYMVCVRSNAALSQADEQRRPGQRTGLSRMWNASLDEEQECDVRGGSSQNGGAVRPPRATVLVTACVHEYLGRCTPVGRCSRPAQQVTIPPPFLACSVSCRSPSHAPRWTLWNSSLPVTGSTPSGNDTRIADAATPLSAQDERELLAVLTVLLA